MSKLSNFSNMNNPYSVLSFIGDIDHDALKCIKVKEIPIDENDDSDCFYAGEPVMLLVNNNGDLVVSSVTDTGKDLQKIKFNAVVISKISPSSNCIRIDKDSNNIAYHIIPKKTNFIPKTNITVAELEGEYMTVKCLEQINPLENVTFAFDENGVIGVKKAKKGDKVYGTAQNIKTSSQNKLIEVKFCIKS